MTAATAARRAVVTRTSDRELRAERIFDAPREKVWRAMTDPTLVVQWWGRGNKLVLEKFEPKKGGHWRFVEHSDGGQHGFEGRFREVTPMDRIVQTFEWDGMPGHVSVDSMTLTDLDHGRTKLVVTSIYHTAEECDGMVNSGMEGGMNESYNALDKLLTTMS